MSFGRALGVVCFTIMLAAVAASFVTPRIHAQTMPSEAASAPHQGESSPPAYSLPPDKLAKAIQISRIREAMELVSGIWSIVVLWLLLATRWAAGLEDWARRISRRRWIQGLIFFALFLVILTIAGLPLDWFSQLMERKYQVSVQTWGSWLGDQGKGLGIALGIGVPVLLLFNWIVKVTPRRFQFWCWVIAVPLIILGTLAEPLLEPVFNQFEPLSKNHSQLVADLEKVVARTGTDIPPDRMFLMKASLKTNGLNAYVSGLGKTKRIVVWDTTAGRVPNDEIMFIFGHETGHYVLHHIVKGLTISAIALFFIFWACAGFASWMVQRFGARWNITPEQGPKYEIAPLATRAGFIVLLLAVSITSFLLQPASNAVSRHFEHQADIYGQEAVHGLVPDPQKTAVSAFNHLGEAWLEDPDPSPLVEFWEFSHPSVQTRANFARNYDPWKNGGHGEFFDK